MKFFVSEEKRKESNSTCYFEFQKGYYHDKCWLEDSISISGMLWEEYHLSDLFGCVLRDFDYYGMTTVTKDQWGEITIVSRQSEAFWYEVIEEATPWAIECFKSYDVFTILGI